MYSFQAKASRRRERHTLRLLRIIIFVLVIALAGVTYSFVRARGVEQATSEAIYNRAITEASEAQSVVYRLTQSSGANTTTLLSTIRGHISALQTLNALAANIYGPGTSVTDASLLTTCFDTISACETRLQAGLVLTDLYTQLRDSIDLIVAQFSAQQ